MSEKTQNSAFTTLVACEVRAARDKYPGNKGRFIALMQEIGEVQQAYAKLYLARQKGDLALESLAHLRMEIIHAGAMIQRLYDELDAEVLA